MIQTALTHGRKLATRIWDFSGGGAQGSMRRAWLGGLVILLAACAPAPLRPGIPTLWRASPNFGERRPNFVVLHHTDDDSTEQALRALTAPYGKTSAHYLIGNDGALYQLVDERSRAWHAGLSKWGADTDLNSSSIGIELQNNGREPFPEVQISSLLALLDDIERRYGIPSENFLGHSDVAPTRKVDPGPYFPWRILAQRGYGLWCEPPLPDAPAAFDAIAALQVVGYDVSDLAAATRAFKLHFAQDQAPPELTDSDKSLLYCLTRHGRPDSADEKPARCSE
ncbi:MAG: N-acetylmuramoyl-L-alanine amidase [Deltaproteobacteria bacterium]|nr:N-acetylmuramoyl-L-alanine amidase [Deltaproteobacteria bacterium]